MARGSRMLGAAWLVALLGIAPASAAESRDAVAAEALFHAGQSAAAAGDWDTACARFAESNRLDPAPGTLLNLADCEEHQGRTASAWQHFAEASEQLAGDDRLATAMARAAALKRSAPHLTIRLAPDAPADTRVTRDGVEMRGASLDMPMPVDPGTHVVIASAPRHDDARFVVRVAAAERVELSVAPGAPAPKPSDAGEPSLRPAAPGPSRTLAVVLLGAGALSLAAAGATGYAALRNANIYRAECDASYACSPRGLDAASRGSTFATASTIGAVTAVIAAAVGLILFFSVPPSSPTVQPGPRRAPLGRRAF